MSLPPLLFMKLLADTKLNPGGLELDVGAGDMNALQQLFAEDSFTALASAFPCLVGDDLARRLPPELLETLLDAGCRMLPGEMTHFSSEQTKPVLPPAARWLSGDWYFAPPATRSGSQAASRSLSLKLLQLVATDADTCEIEAIFRQDPVLAYHLLRLVNSLGVGVGRTISSFAQAILILGRQQLKRWLNLMLFAASRDDYRSAMLLARVAVRARTMELLAKAGGLDRSKQDHAFMAGMFSLLGILFGSPLAGILKPLHLNESLASAVLHHEGELGGLLQAVECSECADETRLIDLLGGLNLSIADYNLLSLDACRWMLGVIHDQQDAVHA
ncbi:MAG: HDOD domain-containing protein [Propionivibrio sp.]|uniref:HDOD domain-containing protein n=1 Tax=Candidatus Propionivibrio dominans TaxID=2954373 RepID=A0A9D7I970_9RHOO|nr:HDOD domain-containing protein [Candidatus Propionivibrio dominans]